MTTPDPGLPDAVQRVKRKFEFDDATSERIARAAREDVPEEVAEELESAADLVGLRPFQAETLIRRRAAVLRGGQ